METLFLIVLFLLMAVTLPRIGAWFTSMGEKAEEERKQQKFFRDRILSNLNDKNNKIEDEDETAPVERLLNANREIQKRKEIRKAMRDELNIDD